MKVKSAAAKWIGVIFIAILCLFGIITTGGVIQDLTNDSTAFVLDDMETMFNDNVFLKEKLVSYNGGFRRLIGQKVVRDADPNNMIIKTGDGSLTSIMWEYDLQPKASAVIGFKEFLDKESMPFLYVMTPYKIIRGYTELPTGIEDYSNEDADEFLAYLKEASVDSIDLRQDLIADHKDLKGLFFRTDHHWQTKTAFWAFSKVAAVLSDQYGFDMDKNHLELEQYSVSSYEKSYLGSQGRRVGQLYIGLDDYDFIEPDFSTNFSVTIHKEDGSVRVQEGDFNQALIYAPLRDMTAPPSTNHYASYFGGDYPEVIIQNHNVENGKLLIIKDSFALPFTAFLATVTEEIHMIDLRYFTKESLCDYIRDYQPDMVMVMYNPSSLSAQSMFHFGT